MESNFVKGCPNCAIQEEQSKKIDDLQSTLNNRKDQLHRAKTELELEKSKYFDELENLNKKVADLESSSKNKQDNITYLSKQFSELEGLLVQSDKSAQELTDKKTAFVSEESSLRESVISMKAEIDSLTQKITTRISNESRIRSPTPLYLCHKHL